MGKSRWNDSLIAVLAETYPVETTAYTAALLGMSETAVKNKAKKLGIVKVAKSRWMERVIFGLSPATRIKVVSNRARVRLRSRLKGIGYVVGQERNILYYTGNVERKERLECRGVKLGLRFLPFPGNELSVLSTII